MATSPQGGQASMWGKFSGGVKAGADATKRAANKVKYKGLISNYQKQIYEIKMRLGVGLFEAFNDGDEEFKQKLFQDARRKIFELEGHILRTEVKIRDKCDPKFVPSFKATTEATHLTAAPKGAKQTLEEKEAIYNRTASPRNRAYSSVPRRYEDDEPAISTSAFLGVPGSNTGEWETKAQPSVISETEEQGSQEPQVHVCSKCSEPISGESLAVPNSKLEYHAHCLACAVCEAKLDASTTLVVNGALNCAKCSEEATAATASSTGAGKELTGPQALLAWAQQSTEGFNQVTVQNFTSSWISGLAFAALVCAWRPDLLPFDVLTKDDTAKIITAAFSAAEQAGVAVLLDPEDVQVADKKSTITQVQMFHRALSKQSPNPDGRAKWNRYFGPL